MFTQLCALCVDAYFKKFPTLLNYEHILTHLLTILLHILVDLFENESIFKDSIQQMKKNMMQELKC